MFKILGKRKGGKILEGTFSFSTNLQKDDRKNCPYLLFGQFGQFGHFGHFLTIWTIWTFLDIFGHFGHFGHFGYFWTFLLHIAYVYEENILSYL